MRVGFISDIHEDVVRLKSALAIISEHDVDVIACLGDLVGFSVPFYPHLATRNANETIEIVRAWCSAVVIGNHDLHAINRFPSIARSFKYPPDWYLLHFQERENLSNGTVYTYMRNELSPLLSEACFKYLAGLPEYEITRLDRLNILCTHYAVPDPTGCCTATFRTPEDLKAHFTYMSAIGIGISVSGNDHLPGALMVTPTQTTMLPFGRHKIPDELTWLCGPAIARGETQSGFMILDENNMTLDIIALPCATWRFNYDE